MKIFIRKGKPGDGKAIAASLKECCNGECKDCFNRYLCNEKSFTEKNISRIDKRLSLKDERYCVLVAIDKDNDKIAGFCSFIGNRLERTEHRAECGWFVNINYARKGIATKLLTKLLIEARKSGLRKLEAEVAVDNLASVKLAEKLGFVREGLKKDSIKLSEKRFIDSFLYGKVLS